MTKYKLLGFYTLLLIISACSSDSNFDAPADSGNNDVINPEDLDEDGRLATFSVDTNGGTIPDEPKINADLEIIVGGQEYYSGKIGIEIRGASSQSYPKKQYGFETWDSEGNDIDVAFFDFPPEEDWILNAPYADKSLMRNKLVYDLSRAMGRYASRAKFVEFKLNGLDKGTYVLLEKIKKDPSRVDIATLKASDVDGDEVTGGYILKIDKGIGGGFNYNSSISFDSEYAAPDDLSGEPIRFQYVYPDYDKINGLQKTYIQDYMRGFENSLMSTNFKDAETGYRSYIDTDSFIDFFILNELGNNVDGFRLSTYMHKPKNEKLVMGPIWDFNFAFGNADYCSGGAYDVWAYKFNERCGGDGWSVPFWWKKLLQDPYFVSKLKIRWNELRGGILSSNNLNQQLDQYYDELKDAQGIDRNFAIWDILDTYVWPNNYIGGSYENEYTYLKTWLADRGDWLDNAINNLEE